MREPGVCDRTFQIAIPRLPGRRQAAANGHPGIASEVAETSWPALAANHRDAPRTLSRLHGPDNGHAVRVDNGDIVRRAVGREQALAVRAYGDSPRTIADLDRTDRHVGLRVDRNHETAAPGGDVHPAAVG